MMGAAEAAEAAEAEAAGGAEAVRLGWPALEKILI